MRFLFLILLFCLFIISCTDTTSEIDKLITDAGSINLSVQEKNEFIKEDSINNFEENEKKWNVKQKTYSLSKNLDHNIITFHPNSNTLWAGAIVQGNEVSNGILNSIGDNIPRSPIKITVKSGDKLFGTSTINNPSNSNYSESLKTILKNVNEPTCAKMIYKETIAYSKEQALLDLGIGCNWLFGSGFESNFITNNNSYSKNIFLFFKQEYYTVSVNEPSVPSDYFGDGFSTNNLKNIISLNNPLCYVASVTYGRLLIVKMTYKGDEHIDEVKSQIDGFINSLFEAKHVQRNTSIIENCEFEGMVLGGSAGGAAKALTDKSINSIINFINEEADYSYNTPGYPISYTVKNLSNNSLVKLSETTEYTIKEYSESSDNSQKFRLENVFFKIDRDCDNVGPGDFYYEFSIIDNSGNSLINGPIENKKNFNSEINRNDGEKIELISKSNTFSIRNKEGEAFRIKGYIFDDDMTEKEVLGKFDEIYEYPWDDILKNKIVVKELINSNYCKGILQYTIVPVR